MPSTINNEASTTYQFTDSAEVRTATSNERSIVLEDSQGLLITKRSAPQEFVSGDIITYSVDISNNSSSYLTGVRIIDNLGNGNLSYVTGSARLTTSTLTYSVTPVSTNPLTFTLQQLNVGSSMTLTYECQVNFDVPVTVSSITNSVQGIGYTSSGTITGFSNSTISRGSGVSDFTISKTATETEVLPHQMFDYYLTLTNGGGSNATVVNITDQLPDNFVLTGVSLRVGSGTTRTLSAEDYSLNGTGLLVIPSLTGPIITVPANGSTVVTISGYFE